MTQETQVALLGQKFDFLTEAVTRLESTMKEWMSKSDQRHDDLEDEMEKRIKNTVEATLPKLIDDAMKERGEAVQLAEGGFFVQLIAKPWFGYFIMALLLFGKEIVPIIFGAFKGGQ